MVYRTILLQLADEERNEARMTFGRGLAKRFGAHLIGMHVTPPPFVAVGYGEGAAYVGPEIIEAQREAAEVVTTRLRDSFSRICEPDTGAASWRHEEGDPGSLFREAARTVDLTLAGQMAAQGIDAFARQLVEEIVLGAGGPVLVLPKSGTLDSGLGKRVLIAWNGGREASRALKDSLGFLSGADQVTLMSAGEDAAYILDHAVAMLGRHGIKVAGMRLDDDAAQDAGATILGKVQDVGADLLVMGAYGHSRLREMVMGGATRHVFQEAPVPVLMSC